MSSHSFTEAAHTNIAVPRLARYLAMTGAMTISGFAVNTERQAYTGK